MAAFKYPRHIIVRSTMRDAARYAIWAVRTAQQAPACMIDQTPGMQAETEAREAMARTEAKYAAHCARWLIRYRVNFLA